MMRMEWHRDCTETELTGELQKVDVQISQTVELLQGLEAVRDELIRRIQGEQWKE